MAALTADRESQRQQSSQVNYTGSSGYKYYAGAMIMKGISGGIIRPILGGASGAGASNGRFLGILENRVDLTNPATGGASQAILRIWKSGEFTVSANGTGASSDIGQVAYAMDDGTVGISLAQPSLPVGEIIAIPTSTTYRIRIDNFVGTFNPFSSGVSIIPSQN